MPGDYTRIPPKLRGLPLMQQGRVLVDADWNELVRTTDRTRRIETIDTIGRAVYPIALPESFHVTLDSTTTPATVMLGPGRYYVEGLLAENLGASVTFEPRIEEMQGTQPIALEKQPYMAPDLPVSFPQAASGTYLAVLDVWQREVSVYEDPGLVDPAIGFDTSTRLETAWQVRLLAVAGSPTCATPTDKIPELVDLVASSGARLSTDAVGAVTSNDPCAVSAQGGYRGIDNRLYRVEIHDPGTSLADATFKWSRDNASVAAIVLSSSAKRLSVQRTGRDSYLKLRIGDTVEVTCNEREWARKTGDIGHVVAIDDVEGFVDLDVAVSADIVTGSKVRVRRWDGGPMPVATGGVPTKIILEDGVQIQVDLIANTKFHVGDHWCFAARAADGSVEQLVSAPPLGTHHHYARLATLTVTNGQATQADCRKPWPPTTGEAKGDCACTVCVTPDDHNTNKHTIQMAIAEVAKTGGRICLLPGVYQVSEAIRIDGQSEIEIVGQGPATKIVGKGGLFRIISSAQVALCDFSMTAGEAPAIEIQNSYAIGLHRLEISTGFGVCIWGLGVVAFLSVTECWFSGRNGIRLGDPDTVTGLLGLNIRGNMFNDIIDTAIEVTEKVMFLDDAVIADNGFTAGKITDKAMSIRGVTLSGVVRIRGNQIRDVTRGIEVGCTFFEVVDNVIVSPKAFSKDIPAAAIIVGAAFLYGHGESAIARNTISAIPNGVLFERFSPTAIVRVQDNYFESISENSIGQVKDSQITSVEIHRNSFLRVSGSRQGVVFLSRSTMVTAEDNLIISMGAGDNVKSAYGFNVSGADYVQINRNELFVDQAGEACVVIRVVDPVTDVEIVGNRIGTTNAPVSPHWTGIEINSSRTFNDGLRVLEELEAKPDAAKIRGLAEQMNRDPEVFVKMLTEADAGRLFPPRFFPQPPNVRVDGNEVIRSVMAQAIHIAQAATVMLSGNRCQASSITGGLSLVTLAATRNALVNANALQTNAKQVAFSWAGVDKLVFSSNVVSGSITPPLPANWIPINIIN